MTDLGLNTMASDIAGNGSWHPIEKERLGGPLIRMATFEWPIVLTICKPIPGSMIGSRLRL